MSRLAAIILLLCGAACCTPLLPCYSTSTQREILTELYDATGGPTWRNNTNWLSRDDDVCSWFGISCTDARVSFILLPSNNLTGTIPPAIGSLITLRYVDLSSNHIRGSIPDTIPCLAELNILKLGGNLRLQGSLSEDIGSLKKLQILELSYNNLTGTIPASLANCTALRSLYMQYNSFSGTIPASFYTLHNLARVDLGYNLFSGTLDESLTQMSTLESVLLNRNSLGGSIPASIGNLRNLKELNLAYNHFEGTIPLGLCSVFLERLVLSGNFLSEGVPACMTSNLTHLTQLDLSRNDLSGAVGPLKLPKLEILDLSTNGLTGSLPDMSSLLSIQFVDLSANHFSGALPEILYNQRLIYMRSFDASSNQLTGTLPNWMGNSQDVSVFLTNNEFLCPYPELIPANVHVDQPCASGMWYQGLFVVVSIVLEFIGFIITVVGMTITLAYLYRPSLLENFGDDYNINQDHMQNRSDCLFRTRNVLLGGCVLEIQVSLLMFLVGVAMFFNAQATDLYKMPLLVSILICSAIFLMKSTSLIVLCIQRWQKGLLAVTVTQILQLSFVVWAFLLEGIAQANALSLCVIALILLDSFCNALAILEAYLIQDQFIPLHQLILDDTLEDSEGSFGEVRHGTYLGIDVAAKRAKPRSDAERKAVYKAFLSEAKILSELGHHSNIVKLIGVSPMLEDEFYIVMEFCDGGTSLRYLQATRETKGECGHFQAVVKLCMGVCDALHYFHSKGYTHRDITTANILVKGGRAMLGDMGLARRIKRKKVDRTRHQYVPRYNKLYGAPELAKGSSYTGPCDVYGFGIALWEMCVLRQWSVGDLERGTGVALEEVRQIHPLFCNIISRCWHEKPEFRPTFAELLEEFSRLNHREWSSYRSTSM